MRVDKMREILFRGKRVDNGEWIYGFITIYSKEYFILYVNDEGVGTLHKVDPETVGQCTPHLDITRKVKIYENDIVEHLATTGENRGKIFINTIEWYEQVNACGFMVIGNNRRCRYGLNRAFIINHKIKVIGNKTDNPDLIIK
jgi:hypothetical protein